jgi:Flp pilus assembly protein TadB
VSGPALFTFVALLVGVLLLILALMVWQESKRRPSYEALEYVVEDAVKHVEAGLEAEGNVTLRRGDIRRILEWEVFYLQGLAQDKRRNPVETIAGGHEASISFIIEQIASKHGVSYAQRDVESVLRHEADYLVRIGAVGDAVDLDGGEDE